jgi:hypothetical protein
MERQYVFCEVGCIFKHYLDEDYLVLGVTPCRWVDSYQRHRETCYLQLYPIFSVFHPDI